MASPVSITRVFNNGNSQAVSIPAEFRLNTDHVQISRNEHGDLVIHPIPVESGQALLQALQALGEIDEKFIAALEAEQKQKQPSLKGLLLAEEARTEYLVPPRGQLKRRKLNQL